MRTFLLAASVLFALPASGSGCPVCNSGTGQQVRAQLLDQHLGISVLATVVPFLIVAIVVAAIHFGGPCRRQQP